VLGDFDRAFFQLQTGQDIYADNPTHYMLAKAVIEDYSHAYSRYPPASLVLVTFALAVMLTSPRSFLETTEVINLN
jgi:hypothetical protein